MAGRSGGRSGPATTGDTPFGNPIFFSEVTEQDSTTLASPTVFAFLGTAEAKIQLPAPGNYFAVIEWSVSASDDGAVADLNLEVNGTPEPTARILERVGAGPTTRSARVFLDPGGYGLAGTFSKAEGPGAVTVNKALIAVWRWTT